MIKTLIKYIALKLGVVLLSEYDYNREQQYVKLLTKLAKQPRSTNQNDCSIIVFSKDRAMQLDALIRSYFHFSKHPAKVHVLYHSSTEEFEAGYRELILAHQDKNIQWVKENAFKKDLVQLTTNLHGSKIVFLVDDIVFKKSVDLERFSRIDPKNFVASLRLGQQLRYSYTTQQIQPLPELCCSATYDDMITWKFNESVLDWAYPLSVDGHLFDAEEIKLLVNELDYKAPNSFEEALQLMNPLFKEREGLCYSESIIVNNPCNKVQVENNNIAGQITIEELNQKWLDGYRIEFERFEGLLNESAHQELSIDFVKR